MAQCSHFALMLARVITLQMSVSLNRWNVMVHLCLGGRHCADLQGPLVTSHGRTLYNLWFHHNKLNTLVLKQVVKEPMMCSTQVLGHAPASQSCGMLLSPALFNYYYAYTFLHLKINLGFFFNS